MVGTGDYRGELFFLALLLSTAVQLSVVVGQQVGVSLKLHGEIIPNNSLIDFDDILYRENRGSLSEIPTNANAILHDQALLCITDLEDCCDASRTVRGDWYYPSGDVVQVDTDGLNAAFRRNRGPNEVRNGRQFYGSVRLFRRFSPRERGRFRCDLPSVADNQTLYVNIVNFRANETVSILVSPTGSSTAGEIYSLMCSATLHPDSIPLPSDVPSPTFEWFFGPNNSSLPSGVSSPETTFNDVDTYTSTLQFSPLSQSHAGMYTCRLGVGRLQKSTTVTVNAPPITVMVTANLNAPLTVGQTGNTLICDVSGADNLSPTITYQWTRNDGSTQTPVGTNSNTLTLSEAPLRLSNSGDYTCTATVRSTLLNNDIIMSSGNTQRVMIQIPGPQSVTVTSSSGNTVRNGSDVTINCTVELGPVVMESEVSLLMVDAQLSRDGTMLNLSNPEISGTTFTYTAIVNSFGRSDSGNYTCMATIRPQPSSVYLNGTGELSNATQVTTGVYFSSRSSYVNENSNILLTDVGEGDCGALLCYTDLTECCGDSDTPVSGVGTLGQWRYPNGSAVGAMSDGQDFYVDRGPSVVRLNRRYNATSTTGQFCCEVPDATSTPIRSCVNIVVASQSERTSVCTRDVIQGVVIAVAATIFIECLIGAPILAAVLALCWKRRLYRKPTEKNAYDIQTTVQGGGMKKAVYELPNEEATSSTYMALQGGGEKTAVYELPNEEATSSVYTALQGGGVNEDVYENMAPSTSTTQGHDGVREDTYDIPDNVAPATIANQLGGGIREDEYEIPDDVGTTNTAIQGGGVRDDVYEIPDNPGVSTAMVNFELTECLAYAETNTNTPEAQPPAQTRDSRYI